jgi:hypothetical protein
MRVTRIDLSGEATDGRYATITRNPGSDHITVSIVTADEPNGREHRVQADCREDLISMARCLQERLDGFRGSNSMAYEYLCELEHFAD